MQKRRNKTEEERAVVAAIGEGGMQVSRGEREAKRRFPRV
jgi:hypothetical protein